MDDITVENLVLDGNREANEELNGNYVGGVFSNTVTDIDFNMSYRAILMGRLYFQVCDDGLNAVVLKTTPTLDSIQVAARSGRSSTIARHCTIAREFSSAGA